MREFFHRIFPNWVDAPYRPEKPSHRAILSDAINEADDMILRTKLRVIRETGVLVMQEHIRSRLVAEFNYHTFTDNK